MALSQRKFSQDTQAGAIDGSERVLGLQGSPLANRYFSIAQLQTLPTFTVSGVPAAASFPRRLIHVSNGNAGSPCVAISDGTDWKVIAIGATIS